MAVTDNDAKWQAVYYINLPRQNVAKSLSDLSEQADQMLLFSYEEVEPFSANPIAGRYTLQQALEIMLRGTGLSGSLTKKEVLMVSQKESSEAKKQTEGIDKMNAKKSLLASTIAFFMGVNGAPVSADQEEVTKERLDWVLEEIVVTATKRSQGLQDTAMAISTLSNDTIDKRNLVGMGDYLSALPGVTVLDQGPGFNSVVIRGLSADPQSEGAESSPVTGVYFGEAAIPGLGITGNSADIKLVNMERVEVLRGLQGTLYGAGDLDLEGGFSQNRLGVRTSTSPPAVSGPGKQEGLEDDIELTSLNVEYDMGWATLSSSTS